MNDADIPKTPPGPHPDVERLMAAWRDADAPGSQTALDHAAQCARCSEELAHIEAFLDQRPAGANSEREWKRFRTGERGATPVLRPSGIGWAAAGLVAAAALVVAIVARRQPPTSDLERGAAAPGAVLVAPNGDVRSAPAEFVFRIPEGRNARVTIFDEDRSFQWTSDPAPGKVALPPQQRSALRTGRDYFWTLTGDGENAPIARFRIVPR